MPKKSTETADSRRHAEVSAELLDVMNAVVWVASAETQQLIYVSKSVEPVVRSLRFRVP